MTESTQLSILVHGPKSKGGGPVVSAALIFKCTDCQYLQPRSDECPGIDQINWTCAREDKLIGTTPHVEDAPSTPGWCALRQFTERDAVKVAAALMDKIEQRNMCAILVSSIGKGMHPSERAVHFPMVAFPNQGISGITRRTKLDASCLVSERQIIDDRLLVHFVQYHESEHNLALVEFPDEVTPGMSRRNWVECTQLVNLPLRR